MNGRQKGCYLIFSLAAAVGLMAGCSVNEEASPQEDKQPEKTELAQQKDETDQPEETQQQGEETAKKTGEKDQGDNIIEISAYEMGYTPPSITFEKGKEYELVMHNEGKVFHDLTAKKLDVQVTYMGDMPDHPEEVSFLKGLLKMKKAYAEGDHDGGHGEEMNYIHMNASPGQTVRIKFIPEETGEFKFFCSVPGHEEAGMHGGFAVESQ
ncbi:plastocyanin/azurin family copper-binding protein [Bacillus marinisedimentorum]|uniref:plastocyanin/azurin family copper-binding protein n=1 Tax=Bacillus marinisedimentorum TaxID=1821260 RepID=UPI0007DE6081|nr:plastocyanin/azurin family copper-binding protein [Bacillus marinisedimentorum]